MSICLLCYRSCYLKKISCVNAHLPPLHTYNADKHDSDEGCADFVLGSNVFQCKTKLEWEGIAKKQCQIRLAAIAETVFASVRYPCRLGRQSYSAPVFQQVEVSCCELSSATSAPTGKLYRLYCNDSNIMY